MCAASGEQAAGKRATKGRLARCFSVTAAPAAAPRPDAHALGGALGQLQAAPLQQLGQVGGRVGALGGAPLLAPLPLLPTLPPLLLARPLPGLRVAEDIHALAAVAAVAAAVAAAQRGRLLVQARLAAQPLLELGGQQVVRHLRFVGGGGGAGRGAHVSSKALQGAGRM